MSDPVDNPRLTIRQRVVVGVLTLYLLSPVLFASLNMTTLASDSLNIYNALLSLLLLTTAFSASRRPRLLHWCLAPFYLTTAMDLFLVFKLGTRLSTSYVTVVLSSMHEAGDFATTYQSPIVVLLGLAIAIMLLGHFGLRHATRRVDPRRVAYPLAATFVIYAAMLGLGWYRSVPLGEVVADLASKERSVPFGVVVQTALAFNLRHQQADIREQRHHHPLHGRRVGRDQPSRQVHVLVIGESSRPMNWSLFGYERDTTPRLRRRSNLVPLTDVLAAAPRTMLAVPALVSLQPVREWNAVIGRKSIVSAFGDAGFDTHWLTTQEADGFAGLIPEIAAEARHQEAFDRLHDQALLAPFRAVLDDARSTSDLFIVLHTKGSHFDYASRYPATFAKFEGAEGRAHTVAAYDNSINYTDWVLDSLIEELDQRSLVASLTYVSDHGENLLDDDTQKLGHFAANTYDLRVAAFVWMSQALLVQSPAKADALRAHDQMPLSANVLAHSLLDLADVTADGYLAERSLFSDQFRPTARDYLQEGQLRRWSEGANATEARAALAP